MNKKQILAQINEILNEMSKERLHILLNQLQKTPSKWNRKYPRNPCSISVDFDTIDYSNEKPIKNLSASGAYIEAEESFTIGQQIMLWLTIPDEKNSPFKINATVVRRDVNGVGVEFENLTAEQKVILSRFKT